MFKRVKKMGNGIQILLLFSTVLLTFVHCTSIPSKLEPVAFETEEALGEALFFDSRLSLDNSISCASCHKPELAFTDGKIKSDGIHGNQAFRNAPSLYNVKFSDRFMFDAHIRTLEEQAIVPLQDTNEMGIAMGDLIRKLRAIPEYEQAAKKIYNRSFDAWVLTRALASFEKTLISRNSPFDQYLNHDQDAISSDAKAGWELFNDLGCISCHALPDFTTHRAANHGPQPDNADDLGRFRVTGRDEDRGNYKIPSLRNVQLTAPYMHNGSIPSLQGVIQHYEQGARSHPNHDSRIKQLELTNEDYKKLIEFLETLTDNPYKVN